MCTACLECFGLEKDSLAIGSSLCILAGNCRRGDGGDGKDKSGVFIEAVDGDASVIRWSPRTISDTDMLAALVGVMDLCISPILSAISN